MKKSLASILLSVIAASCFVLGAAANAPGDVTGDGAVTAEDARLCLRQAVGLESYATGNAEFAACDITGDGAVTAEDARLILRIAVGLETPEDHSGPNEYDILRSGTFYITGFITDSGVTQPLEIAITPNSVYMLTKMEGVDMGMLQQNGTLYMLYPAKQIYMEMSSVIMGMMGMSSDELLDISSLGFSDMPDLSGADTVADGEFNGSACKIYSFNKESGSRIVVYMNGNKLLGFEDVSSSGTATTTITSITSTVPADKSAPPAGYKKVNMVSFMIEMKDVIG